MAMTSLTRRILAAIIAILPCVYSAGEVSLSLPHPRLLVTEEGFESHRKALESNSNEILMHYHKEVMARADKFVGDSKPFEFKKDASGKRILPVSRRALEQIFHCSYAYRMTGDRKYLSRVEAIVDQVCDFPSWNPSHFLDVAEMTLGVAIAYDWLYYDLRPEIKEKAGKTIVKYGLEARLGEWLHKKIYDRQNNWNQVCNGGLVSGAIATWELAPETAKDVVEMALKYNAEAVKTIYSPDGVYPEGPAYWSYGTSYQIVLNTALTTAFGTDFGLSDIPGFSRAAQYIAAVKGPCGGFNYGDNNSSDALTGEIWYFVERFADYSSLQWFMSGYKQGKRLSGRLMPLHLFFMGRTKDLKIQDSTPGLYSGRGRLELAIARTGYEKDDLYLAIKAGSASLPHAHMDAGSFIFDAYGVRWAKDLGRNREYELDEKALKKIGGDLWDKHQDSYRWDLFANNNLQHNTISIGYNKHIVEASARMIRTIDEDGCKGAVIDITDVLGGKLAKAERTALLKENSYLEISDLLIAPAKSGATVRWTLVTEAEPTVTEDGIVLEKKGIRMKVSAEGAKVKWQTWSSNPADYLNNPTANFGVTFPDSRICGYTLKLKKGEKVTVKVTMKRIND